MLAPAESFLCCMPLSLGTKLILWAHLSLAVFTAAMEMGSIAMSGQYSLSVAEVGPGQIFNAIWSTLGVPLIMVALWGAYHRLEPHVRFYLYYLAICVVIDIVCIIDLFLVQDSCVHLKLAVAARGSKAFACGVARGISGATAAVSVVAVLYMVYIIWSFCEDLDDSSASMALSDLLALADGRKPRRQQSISGYQSDILGSTIDATKSIGSGAAIVYGSVTGQNRFSEAANLMVGEFSRFEDMAEGDMRESKDRHHRY
mmetsp:Transcript_68075/g.122681  ORF Transcript_68075/g.122681 Transcript_68075/m.122681 type:complete len:258 (-) Transcript_68075:17-790(-)